MANLKQTELIMEILFNNDIYEIELKDNLSSINGQDTGIEAGWIGGNKVMLRLKGEKVIAYVAEDDEHYYVSIEGQQVTLDKPKDEEKSFDEDSESGDREEVYPPMPGSIVKVIVEPDQKVTEGEALIIVEAMKMETTLYSSIDGIVKEVNVEAGQQVNSDDILILVEKEDAE